MVQLNDNFLFELFKIMFRKRDIIEICIEHLKFEYLPNEQFKKIWKNIKQQYQVSNGLIPSIGVIAQQVSLDQLALDIIEKIKKVELQESDSIISQLDEYIKDAISVEAYETFVDVYNTKSKEEAREIFVETGAKLTNFTIKKNHYFEKVFAGFENRHRQRISDYTINKKGHEKVPFNIDELDAITDGGLDITDTCCFVSRSGKFKTKALRWVGVGAATRSFNVLHIQAEGSKKDCLDGYDATWTAILMNNIKQGNINDKQYRRLQEIIKDQTFKKDIYVHAFEQFNSGSMRDVRQLALDFNKSYGEVDLIICDYLEKFETGDGKRYNTGYEGEKMRRIALADKFKNIATELQTRGLTATQASDINPEQYNDPDWKITRHNIAMNKNLVDPFSYFITFNQTNEEYKNHQLRLYVDKLRNYQAEQIIRIYQNLTYDRFYDRQRTIEEFYKIEK